MANLLQKKFALHFLVYVVCIDSNFTEEFFPKATIDYEASMV